MTAPGLHIGHDLLDVQLEDADGRRVGRVDDLELAGDPPRVTALLTGDGLYPRRVPAWARRATRRLVGPETWGDNAVRIAWGEIDAIGATIRLRRKAHELGLGAGDEPRSWVARRLPWN